MAAALPFELSRLFEASDVTTENEAWTAFVAEHSRLLLHVARSLNADRDAAMDAYAYVLEQLREDRCRRLRGFAADGRSRFTTWLVVVARRLCVDFQRHRYGRARDATSDSASELAARRRLLDLVGADVDPDEIEGTSRDPAEALQAAELHDALESAIARLPRADRLLLKLRFENDLSAREIADVLRLPSVFHAYRRINAVVDVLRRDLRSRGVEGPGS